MNGINENPVFLEIAALIEKELARYGEQRPSRTKALLQEKNELQQRTDGWSRSLGRPDLDDSLRRNLESQWAEAKRRLIEIEQELQLEAALDQRQQFVLDPNFVAEKLEDLGTLLTSDNATLVNFELALHIDEIRCGPNGQVVMRTCKLGIVPDVIDLVRQADGGGDVAAEQAPLTPSRHGRPRRRTRLALSGNSSPDREAMMHFALDPHRFAGLTADFFWLDHFQAPVVQCWAERNADAVYQRQQEAGKISKDKLAQEFGVSIPTIRKALKIANQRSS